MADDIEHMLNILAQCQDIVIDLGNYIEQMKGEHHPSAKKCVVGGIGKRIVKSFFMYITHCPVEQRTKTYVKN